VQARELEPAVEDDRVGCLEEARQTLAMGGPEGRWDNQIGHVPAQGLVGAKPKVVSAA